MEHDDFFGSSIESTISTSLILGIASVGKFEQDHPVFPLQEEGQSGGTESPERGPVSTRKTDRLHDL